jgi:SAM-dependent methyltransferase
LLEGEHRRVKRDKVSILNDFTMDQPPAPRPAWQTSLDFDAQPEDHYLDYYNAPLLDMVQAAPRRVLELGCAGGLFGAKLKERWPQAHVTGVEAGKAAAAKAATRLDRVIQARLELLDLAAEGYHDAAFDLVIAADVLEHVVNPWKLLVDLRPFLAPDAVLVASIPNVRNLALINDLLLGGRWHYAERGLLDVTHLRFFTLGSIHEMFGETGYRVESVQINIAPDLAAFWQQVKDQPTINIRSGRFAMENVTPAELNELCAQQFFLRVRLSQPG